MNALQPQHDPLPRRPVRSATVQAPTHAPTHARPQRRSRTQSRRHSPHQAAILEVGLKLSVNLILIATAASTLAHLIPYNMGQQSDLERLQNEVKEANAKVSGLQEDFDRHFDPQQALNVMQEQNIRFNPRQKQVVWLKPKPPSSPADRLSDASVETATPD